MEITNEIINKMGITIVWIDTITAICAFSVSGLSIFLGYKLFLAGAKGELKFNIDEKGKIKVGLKSVLSSIVLTLFGMFIAIYALIKLLSINNGLMIN